MSAGLFALTCPRCGQDLEVDHLGAVSCVGCGRSYLSRFGYLIPTDLTEDLPAALHAEG